MPKKDRPRTEGTSSGWITISAIVAAVASIVATAVSTYTLVYLVRLSLKPQGR
jgi:hypothetical protein